MYELERATGHELFDMAVENFLIKPSRDNFRMMIWVRDTYMRGKRARAAADTAIMAAIAGADLSWPDQDGFLRAHERSMR